MINNHKNIYKAIRIKKSDSFPKEWKFKGQSINKFLFLIIFTVRNMSLYSFRHIDHYSDLIGKRCISNIILDQ